MDGFGIKNISTVSFYYKYFPFFEIFEKLRRYQMVLQDNETRFEKCKGSITKLILPVSS